MTVKAAKENDWGGEEVWTLCMTQGTSAPYFHVRETGRVVLSMHYIVD